MDIIVENLLLEMVPNIEAKLAHYGEPSPLMIGIHTGGLWIAEKLHQKMNNPFPLGALNIAFYRDDFTRIGMHPQVKPSKLPFNITDRGILLIDDVLYTGRTIRAALNEIFDYGRPRFVMLAVLVDRAGRELPIQADVVGKHVALNQDQHIKLTGPETLRLAIT